MYYAHATIPIHATERKSVLLVLGCKLLCYPPREGWWERSDSGKYNANECSVRSSVISTHPLEVTQHLCIAAGWSTFFILSLEISSLEKKANALDSFSGPNKRESERPNRPRDFRAAWPASRWPRARAKEIKAHEVRLGSRRKNRGTAEDSHGVQWARGAQKAKRAFLVWIRSI
jgi:hypothetical protein